MKKDIFLSLFSQLGDYLAKYLRSELKDPVLDEAIEASYENNPLFTPWFQRYAIRAVAECFLDGDLLRRWIDDYEHLRVEDGSFGVGDKSVEIVMAGNIPMVGFHDLLVAIAAGVKVRVKLSSKDPFLFPSILKIIAGFEEGLAISGGIELIDKSFYDNNPSEPDALLFMGSDESSLFFERKYPLANKLFRRSRTSIGVIYRDITKEEVNELADAILLYYGMGCRSVTHLKIEQGFNIERIAEALNEKLCMTDNSFIYNIFRRNRAVLNMDDRLFYYGANMILLEDEQYISSPGIVTYSYFREDRELIGEFKANDYLIQKIYYNFDRSQRPGLKDYPDDKDTLLFLLSNK